MTTDERIHEILYSTDSREELASRIAELEEFAQDLWQFTGAACKKYPRMFDPAAQGPQMVQLNALDAFDQRMRELGIEVPE